MRGVSIDEKGGHRPKKKSSFRWNCADGGITLRGGNTAGGGKGGKNNFTTK